MPVSKTNKFTKNLTLSYKDIRGKRAEFISDDAQNAQEELIRDLQTKKRAFEKKLLNLEDLSPDSEMSLHPTKGSFDGKQWVKEIQDTKVNLQLLEVQLTIANATYDEYFK